MARSLCVLKSDYQWTVGLLVPKIHDEYVMRGLQFFPRCREGNGACKTEILRLPTQEKTIDLDIHFSDRVICIQCPSSFAHVPKTILIAGVLVV